MPLACNAGKPRPSAATSASRKVAFPSVQRRIVLESMGRIAGAFKRSLAGEQSCDHRLSHRTMMHDMMPWMSAGMGLVGVLTIAVLVLAIAALIKYLRS
jgi:hypothetical protein